MMNAFQKRIIYFGTPSPKASPFEKVSYIPSCFSCKEAKTNNAWKFDFSLDKDELFIAESEDILSTVYYFQIEHTAIKSVSSRVGEKWVEAAHKGNSFTVTLDFDNKASEIKISFKHEIAPDYVFKVIYKDADKELCRKRKEAEERKENERKAAEHQKALDEAVNVQLDVGNGLVNIYFSPCSTKCKKTVIELSRGSRLIARYEEKGDILFKAITNLAYGQYSFKLKQYDMDNELLYESHQRSFLIKSPASEHGVSGDAV